MHELLLALCLTATPASAASPVKASSEGADASGNGFPASQAFDGLLTTGWAEGDVGGGKGSWIELKFDRPVDVYSVSIWPGKMDFAERSLREYGRPHSVTVTLATARGDVVTPVRLLDPGEQGMYRQDVSLSAAGATSMRVTLDEVVTGGIYDLTFLSEIAVNFASGDTPSALEGVNAWVAGPTGQAAVAKDRAEVIALFDTIKANEFGDREALRQIMDRAADGMPALRAQVAKIVPAGFRVAALPPGDAAVEALLKLKDSNAIPAITLAALRSKGPRAADLMSRASMFNAYQQMVGGGRRNLPAWGSTGWEKGALQGLGEPLPIAISPYGEVLVVDVANHRVQRFDQKGVSDRVWGGEPDLASTWFSGTRAWYAAGSKPATTDGSFSTPVALALLPGKNSSGFAVLDAARRVSRFDGEGNLLGVTTLDVDGNLSPGVGGEGHLLYSKGKLVAIWANEGRILDMKGVETGRFELADGAPTGAVVLAGGKLGLVYGSQLVMYSADGFRHGEMLHGTLGAGFEAWSPAVDEKGKLWAVLDTGEVIKFKSPGVVDYRFKLVEWSLHVPRMAVYDSFVYVTSDDKILRGDALALSTEQAAASNP
ncbi:MAG: hypothetical protein H0V89_02635 [Deltaproteobacteria bacterium]|nr:hypothetical protein [Deltaproteobacteria bacterium]